jgi:hypothetical protein
MSSSDTSNPWTNVDTGEYTGPNLGVGSLFNPNPYVPTANPASTALWRDDKPVEGASHVGIRLVYVPNSVDGRNWGIISGDINAPNPYFERTTRRFHDGAWNIYLANGVYYLKVDTVEGETAQGYIVVNGEVFGVSGLSRSRVAKFTVGGSDANISYVDLREDDVWDVDNPDVGGGDGGNGNGGNGNGGDGKGNNNGNDGNGNGIDSRLKKMGVVGGLIAALLALILIDDDGGK